MDYKDTLNLPKTGFPMKAGLAEQEPERLKKWAKSGLYRRILGKRKSDGGLNAFVLHDGPPYANGNIHLGTAMNKILKDFVIKSKSGNGYYSPYIPGWDCHGLPIEHKVDKELGDKKLSMSKNEIRKLCREYANHWLNIQRESFKRLGVIGDWDNPYITMDYDYEAVTLKEFYKVLKGGGVYKGSKPVYWCHDCVTALAEAEVEYADKISDSIYVKFALTKESAEKIGIEETVYAVIWTTTPWTLPANMAISVNPAEDYSLMRIKSISEGSLGNLKQGDLVLIASPIVNSTEQDIKKDLSIESWEEIKKIEGSKLENLEAIHPFYDRVSKIITGDHVLMTGGTGLVHTAPAHGVDDYAVSMKYGIEVFNPVDDYGKFKSDLPLFAGLHVNDANSVIIDYIKNNGSLVANSKIKHSFPHCWRCKTPVIFRATPQWFISMEYNDLREKAINEVRNIVKFIPSWGANRIGSMLESRPDWCISRQRTWGVPIAVFTCRQCENIIFDEEIEEKVLDSFKQSGADAWFEHDVAYYLGNDAKCPHCGSNDIKQETDILDVWFDSGTSHAAVCEVRPELFNKADIYLEGSDQHRGWFQSSLLESVATRGKAPFKEVLTHGFILDNDMRKMAKSLGNIITPEELAGKFGAEIIRLWVASEDYTNDISISNDIIKRQVETYRKIRNTMRYLLGNLYDFNPDEDMVSFNEMLELDKYTLIKWNETLQKIYAGYDNYQFHVFYHTFINFCTNDLSALYLDVIKDRLYSYAPDSHKRKSAQTALFILARQMATVMYPVLSFTADEVWDNMPQWEDKSEFIFEELFPKNNNFEDKLLQDKIDKLVDLKKEVNKALEIARGKKLIGHSLDAEVYLQSSDTYEIDEEMKRFLIVSDFKLITSADIEDSEIYISDDGKYKIFVKPSKSEKCSRCWTKDETVQQSEEKELCSRCAEVLEKL